MESSLERVREARIRRPGDCEAREREIASPRELGDTPVTTTCEILSQPCEYNLTRSVTMNEMRNAYKSSPSPYP